LKFFELYSSSGEALLSSRQCSNNKSADESRRIMLSSR